MYHSYPTGTRGFFLSCGRKLRCRPPTLGAARLWRPHRKVSGTQSLSFVICSVTCEVIVFSSLIYRTWNRGLCERIISWKKDRNQALRLGKELFNFAVVSDQWLFLLVFISLTVSFFSLFFFQTPAVKIFVGRDQKHFFNGTIDDVSNNFFKIKFHGFCIILKLQG